MRTLGAIVLLAFVFLLPIAKEALSDPLPPATTAAAASSSVGAGPWVVGGVGVGVLSVMIRAAVVGNRAHRELTSAEAWGAFALPFVWVFAPIEPCRVGIPGDPCRISRRTSITSRMAPTEPCTPGDPCRINKRTNLKTRMLPQDPCRDQLFCFVR